MIERVRGIKEKVLGQQKFSIEDLFAMLESANIASISSETDSDGELSNISLHENFEVALKKVGYDCLDYYYLNRLNKRDYMFFSQLIVGTITFGIGMRTNNPTLVSFAIGCITTSIPVLRKADKLRKEKINREDVTWRDHDLWEKKKIIRSRLLALSLPEDYIEKHFSEIVGAFAKRQQPIAEEEDKLRRDAEETKKLEEKELEIRKERLTLGLINENEQPVSLDQLVSDQEYNHNSIS